MKNRILNNNYSLENANRLYKTQQQYSMYTNPHICHDFGNHNTATLQMRNLIEPQIRTLTQNPSLECSFAHSDFVYECDNTLRKFYTQTHTRSAMQTYENHMNNSTISLMNRIDHYHHIMPTIPSIQPFIFPYYCHLPYYTNCNCIYSHLYDNKNLINPSFYPLQMNINDIQSGRLITQPKYLYMQTDGTLGLQAIRLEKPYYRQTINSINYQNTNEPVKLNLKNRTLKPQIKNDLNNQVMNIDKFSMQTFADRNAYSNTQPHKNHKKNFKNRKNLVERQHTKIHDDRNNFRPNNSLIPVQTNLAINESSSDKKSSDNYKFNESKLVIEESLSSLDDFIRSPYYKKSKNIDAYKYNSDYSTDTISVDTALKSSLNAATFDKNSNKQAPMFLSKPNSIAAKIGDNVKFRCSFYGKPLPTLYWYLNKINLNNEFNTRKYKIYAKNGYHYLKIFNLKYQDAGKISCLLENSIGKCEAFAHLVVSQRDDEDSLKTSKNQTNSETIRRVIKQESDQQIEKSIKSHNEHHSYQNTSNEPIIFNENILYKFDNYVVKDENDRKLKQEIPKSQSTFEINKQRIGSSINRSKSNHHLTYRQVLETKNKYFMNNNQNRLDLPLQQASFDDEHNRRMNDLYVQINDRITITCNNQNSVSSYWIHPKGFIIKDSKQFKLYADGKVFRLDILNAQLEDSGTYRCIKTINGIEMVAFCKIIVTEKD